MALVACGRMAHTQRGGSEAEKKLKYSLKLKKTSLGINDLPQWMLAIFNFFTASQSRRARNGRGRPSRRCPHHRLFAVLSAGMDMVSSSLAQTGGLGKIR